MISLQKRMANKFHLSLKQQSRHILGFPFYQTITTWPEALLENWGKLALMFHENFHCIKTIKVRKGNIFRVRPLTALF